MDQNTACLDVAETMRRIYAHGLTSTSGGNVSCRDERGLRITAAAVDKGLLTEHDVALVGMDGALVHGPRPSSEWPFHVAIYRARPDIRAIVHAHSPALVAASLLEDKIDTRLVPSCFDSCGQLGRSSYAIPGTVDLGAELASVFAQGFDCVLMKNHGIVVGAESLFQALARLEILEMTARAVFTAREIGNLKKPAAETVSAPELPHDHACDEGPSGPVEPAATDLEAAADLAHFASRGNRRQLLQLGRGGLSVRCHADPTRYLATPRPCDFTSVTAQQLITQGISDQRDSCGGGLSRLLEHASLYDALYQSHSDVHAIIHAHPPYATAFSLVHADHLPVTIPESYIVLGHVPIIDPRARSGDMIENIVSSIDARHSTVIIAHEGVIVTGRNMLEAFDRLEVLEATAESIVRARRLGSMAALSPADVQQLEARRRSHAISKSQAISP